MMKTPETLSEGHVALVTGAASGIGRAAARRFAALGMGVALVDLPGDELDRACEDVRSATSGPPERIQSLAADLAVPADVTTLHDRLMTRFGRIDLLMNNAVTRTGRGWDAPITDWRRAMEVNFWAIVETVDLFLPDLANSRERAMIINVGSKQGITNPPGHPVYNVTKSALKTYTEQLEHHCRSGLGRPVAEGVSVHLLIPGWTTTGRADHKPGAWFPDQVVDRLIQGLGANDFYILCPDDETTTEMDHRRIVWAAGDITENRPPLSRWHPDYRDEAARWCS